MSGWANVVLVVAEHSSLDYDLQGYDLMTYDGCV